MKDQLSSSKEKNVLVLLKEEQERIGYIPEQIMKEIAEEQGLSEGEVYGIATFYSFLRVKPTGRNVIKVCRSLPCHLKNAEELIAEIYDILGILPGETTADGRYSLELTNCIGACDQSPAILINDDLHGNLIPGKIKPVLETYK